MVNEGHDQAMEFADGNYGLLQGALEYSQDVTAPDTSIEFSAAETAATRSTTASSGPTRRRSSTTRPTARRRRSNRRSTSRRACAAGRGADAHHARRPHRQVDRGGHQGQRLAGQEPASAGRRRRGDGTVGGTVPATLSLSLGTPASFGAFTPGVATRVHGVDDGDRGLDRRRRDADGRRPGPPTRASWSTARSCCRSRCRASASSRRGRPRPQRGGAGPVQAGHRRQRRAAHGHATARRSPSR